MIQGSIFVADLQQPLQVSNMVQVLGPRPRVGNAKASFSYAAAVELRDGEVPAETAVSFAMQVYNIDSRPNVELGCAADRNTKQPLARSAGQRQGASSLDIAGEGVLFLSVVPGSVGQSGCKLMAEVTTATAGISDPFLLRQIIELPQIDSFNVTDEKLGELYEGTLIGKNLEVIEKTGWDANTGYATQGIPTPVPGVPGEQTLKVAVPWPPPSPKAPLYIWLRGETAARVSNAKY